MPAGDTLLTRERTYPLTLCGGCQAHGVNPKIVDGVCITCERTIVEVFLAHAAVNVEGDCVHGHC